MFERNITEELIQCLKLIKVNSELITNESIVACNGDFDQLFLYFVDNHLLEEIKIDFQHIAYTSILFNNDKYPVEILKIENGADSLIFGPASHFTNQELVILNSFEINRNNNQLVIKRRFSTNQDVKFYFSKFSELNDLLLDKIGALNNDIKQYNYFINHYAEYHARMISKSFKNYPTFYGKK